MWWLMLLVALIVIGYFLYKRQISAINLYKEQAKLTLDFMKKERDRIKIRKQEVIDEAVSEGKIIPLAPILENLKKLKAEHHENKAYITEMESQVNELKEKYGESIPVEEAYKLLTSFENEYGPV